MDEKGEPWFVAKDESEILGITWSGRSVTLAAFPASWISVMNFMTQKGPRAATIINEAGLYKLAFRSRKPKADRFTNWVASEVLPTLRKTGTYTPTTGKAQVRTIVDEKGERWFVAKAVGNTYILELERAIDSVKYLDPDEKNKVFNKHPIKGGNPYLLLCRYCLRNRCSWSYRCFYGDQAFGRG